MGQRIDAIQVVDIEDNELAPTAAERPKARRGRPRGSTAKIASDGSHISVSETSFMRAVVQGVDAKLAANRYLLHLRSMDRRAATAYRDLLQQRIHLSLNTLPDQALGERILAMLQAQAEPAQQLPSLDEFAERFDPDMYSEKELLALYREQPGEARRSC